jgi:oligoendopeptidase F
MTIAMTREAALPSWDLSLLYQGIDDPALQQDVAAAEERARQFADAYRGRIHAADLTAERLLAALQEYEEIQRLADRPHIYASLLYAADVGDPRHGALVQQLQEAGSRVQNLTLFFELEVCALPAAQFEPVAADPRLAPYRHYLRKERRLAAFRLSEPEEKILEEKANSGRRAFQRLFDESVANHTFTLCLHGETHELPEASVLALLYDPERESRRAAAAALTSGLKAQSRVLGLTFNTLLLDKWTDDRLRGFGFPEQSRHLQNELEPEVVAAVVDACVVGFPLVADYYRLKGRLLGIEPLTHFDRYAPLAETSGVIPYEQARDLVLDAYGAFSAEVRAAAAEFFSGGRIDAAVRSGKAGGAFCMGVDAETPPYVLTNYTGRARDVMTLAHELGHGVHNCLAQRQSYLNYRPVLPLAETASVFGEMLVFERLLAQLPGDRERLALLCEKIEDTFATTFRQISLYRFEQAVHRQRREQGELAVDAINGLWHRTLQEMFGDSVMLGEDHAWWWLYIPHFIHTPFYVYAYAVGELLVLSLYARYRREGAGFVPRYLGLLAAGGSRSPEELLADLGIDLRQSTFWEGGIAIIGDYVRQAKELAGT